MGKFHDIRSLMVMSSGSPGIYVFASTDTRSIASLVIRAVTKQRFSHAGILWTQGDCGVKALHMKGKGLVHDTFLDVLRESDNVRIVKYEMTEENFAKAQVRIAEILERGSSIRYDFAQKLGGQDLYCSELVWRVLQGLVGDKALEGGVYLGREAFSPDDVVNHGRLVFERYV
jgi:hypothetical protein